MNPYFSFPNIMLQLLPHPHLCISYTTLPCIPLPQSLFLPTLLHLYPTQQFILHLPHHVLQQLSFNMWKRWWRSLKQHATHYGHSLPTKSLKMSPCKNTLILFKQTLSFIHFGLSVLEGIFEFKCKKHEVFSNLENTFQNACFIVFILVFGMVSFLSINIFWTRKYIP